MLLDPRGSRATWRSAVQWLAAVAVGLCVMASGCPRQRQAAGPAGPAGTATALPDLLTRGKPLPPDPGTQSAAIFLSGDFRSFVKPCGCTPDQPGGLVRLARILDAARQLAESKSVDAVAGWLAGAGAAEPGAIAEELAASMRTESAEDFAQRVWPIECGNFSWVGGRYADIRLRGYIKQLHHAGYRAIVPGAGELQLRADEAKALANSEVPIVSCNLELQEELFTVQPYIELAPGWYLTGLSTWQPLSQTAPTGSWWKLSDPVQSVQRVLDSLPESARLIVVAAYQDAPVLGRLSAMPIDVLIGSGGYYSEDADDGTGKADIPVMPYGRKWLGSPAVLPAAPPKAVFLPVLMLEDPGNGLRAAVSYVAVDRRWPDDAQADRILDGQNELLRQRLSEVQAELANAAGIEAGQFGMSDGLLPESQQQPSAETLRRRLAAEAQYLGNSSCAPCHAASHGLWESSKHAHALQTLTANQQDNNLDCLQCHTVGLYEPSGFDPNSPKHELSGVGCESCHGPGSQHVAAAKLAELEHGAWPLPGKHWDNAQYSIKRSSVADCLHCHDPYNSPRFEAASYWQKIAH